MDSSRRRTHVWILGGARINRRLGCIYTAGAAEASYGRGFSRVGSRNKPYSAVGAKPVGGPVDEDHNLTDEFVT